MKRCVQSAPSVAAIAALLLVAGMPEHGEAQEPVDSPDVAKAAAIDPARQTSKDFTAAEIEELKVKAGRGDADAQFNLGFALDKEMLKHSSISGASMPTMAVEQARTATTLRQQNGIAKRRNREMPKHRERSGMPMTMVRE